MGYQYLNYIPEKNSSICKNTKIKCISSNINRKKHYKIHLEPQETSNSQRILRKKNKTFWFRGIALSGFKIYDKATVIKSMLL